MHMQIVSQLCVSLWFYLIFPFLLAIRYLFVLLLYIYIIGSSRGGGGVLFHILLGHFAIVLMFIVGFN